ncbi:MAG: hypothetical protein R3296_09100 [Oleiphilaceae bacterium]|nr:hypothetical protein [Oleiphilaceae bacterium]
MKMFGVDHRPWPTPLKWLALASGAWLVVLMLINQYLITPDAPQGLISYELAGESDRVAHIRQNWGEEGQFWAHLSLYLDFFFIGVYLAFLLRFSNHLLLDRPGVREQQLGRLAKGFFVLGAGGDAGENLFLILAIARPEDDQWPMVAVTATLVKLTGLLIGAAALLVLRASRRHPLTTDHSGD